MKPVREESACSRRGRMTTALRILIPAPALALSTTGCSSRGESSATTEQAVPSGTSSALAGEPACEDFDAQGALAEFFARINAQDIGAADEMLSRDGDFLAFVDLKTTLEEDDFDTANRADAKLQLRDIVRRGETFEIVSFDTVGEQNRDGLLEFNFGMNRLTNDGAQRAGGKGAVRCETGRLDLLLLGTGIVE
jgi:hypothetical protein